MIIVLHNRCIVNNSTSPTPARNSEHPIVHGTSSSRI